VCAGQPCVPIAQAFLGNCTSEFQIFLKFVPAQASSRVPDDQVAQVIAALPGGKASPEVSIAAAGEIAALSCAFLAVLPPVSHSPTCTACRVHSMRALPLFKHLVCPALPFNQSNQFLIYLLMNCLSWANAHGAAGLQCCASAVAYFKADAAVSSCTGQCLPACLPARLPAPSLPCYHHMSAPNMLTTSLPTLPCPALSCPALHCPALRFPALRYLALSCLAGVPLQPRGCCIPEECGCQPV